MFLSLSPSLLPLSLQIMSKCRIQPAVLQCEAHPYLNQQRLIDHAAKYNIVFTAYSPLGSPDRPWARPNEPVLMENPTLIAMAGRYNKSVAQVLIRYQVERGVVVIPKSVTAERIKSNFDVSSVGCRCAYISTYVYYMC